MTKENAERLASIIGGVDVLLDGMFKDEYIVTKTLNKLRLEINSYGWAIERIAPDGTLFWLDGSEPD